MLFERWAWDSAESCRQHKLTEFSTFMPVWSIVPVVMFRAPAAISNFLK